MKEFKGEQIAEEQLESLLDKLVYEEPQLNDFSELQKEFDCEISVDIEKHNQLQYTYYYEIIFNNKDTSLFIEIENGINNGTKINNIEWGISNKPYYRTVEVLKEISKNFGILSTDFVSKLAVVIVKEEIL